MWLHWHPDPGIIPATLVVCALYWLVVGPARRWIAPEEPFPKVQAGWFYAGMLMAFIALASPIDYIGEKYLLSVHMVQHMLLIFVVPPLLLLGVKDWMLKPVVSENPGKAVFGFLTHPLVAFLIFNGFLTLWHIPAFYDWALRDDHVHALEHISFVLTGILMYWPLMSPMKEFPRLHYGPQLLYVMFMGLAQMPLFAFLTFSHHCFYPPYVAAPRIVNLTPLQDQVLGGVIMKVSVMIWMFCELAVIFGTWYRLDRSGRAPEPRGLGSTGVA